MLHTLWRSATCILTLFPGIISLLLRRLPAARRCSETNLFLGCAMAVVVYDVITSHPGMASYLFLPAVVLAVFLLEVACSNGMTFLRSSLRAMYHQLGRFFVTLIVFPVLEEYLYRYYLYGLLMESGGSVILFVITSTLFFVGSHLYSQRERALTKIPLGAILALVYASYRNLFFCLSIHLSFNLCIFFYNQVVRGSKHNY